MLSLTQASMGAKAMTKRTVSSSPHALRALAVLALGACAHQPATPPAEPESSEYTIGREDVLEIAVWKDAALTTTAPVRPDGRVSVPMIGDVDAEGRTPRQIAAEIQKRLEPYVKEPVVSVIVREINSRKVSVVGEVVHPGVYLMRGPMNMLQAVAQAGGTTEFAAKSRVVLIRRGKRYSVDMDRAVESDDGVPRLQAGDTIYVP
jgi:polysaccharide export outer membrane protein